MLITMFLFHSLRAMEKTLIEDIEFVDGYGVSLNWLAG